MKRLNAFFAFYVLTWLIPLAIFGLLYFWVAPLEVLNRGPVDPATLLPEALRATGYREVDLVSLVSMVRYAPATIVVVLYAAAPSIAALIVVAFSGGRNGVASLLARLNPVHGGLIPSRDAYLTLFAGISFVVCLGLLLSQVAGKGVDAALSNMAAAPLLGLWSWLLYAALLDEGGTLEELGWRGFAQPFVAARLDSPLLAAILVGSLWSLWHLPIRLTSPYIMNANLHWALYLFVLWVSEVGVSIIAVYFVNRSCGSVWPAVIVHGFSNNMNATFAHLDPVITSDVNVVTGGLVFRVGVSTAAAAVILLFAGRRLGLMVSSRGKVNNADIGST